MSDVNCLFGTQWYPCVLLHWSRVDASSQASLSIGQSLTGYTSKEKFKSWKDKQHSRISYKCIFVQTIEMKWKKKVHEWQLIFCSLKIGNCLDVILKRKRKQTKFNELKKTLKNYCQTKINKQSRTDRHTHIFF